MPFGDGTGPMGKGAMTGRGVGFCRGFSPSGIYLRRAGRLGIKRIPYRFSRFSQDLDDKKLLNKEKEILEKRLENIKERLSSINDNSE